MNYKHLCSDCLEPRSATEDVARVACPRCGGWHRVLVRETAYNAVVRYLESHDKLAAISAAPKAYNYP